MNPNLIVLKRAMTTQELNDFRLTKMKAYSDKLLIQNKLNIFKKTNIIK